MNWISKIISFLAPDENGHHGGDGFDFDKFCGEMRREYDDYWEARNEIGQLWDEQRKAQEDAVWDALDRKEKDTLMECFRIVAEKARGVDIELKPDGQVRMRMTAICESLVHTWDSVREFLLGSEHSFSVFYFLGRDTGKEVLNVWMRPFIGCASAQELALKMFAAMR